MATQRTQEPPLWDVLLCDSPLAEQTLLRALYSSRSCHPPAFYILGSSSRGYHPAILRDSLPSDGSATRTPPQGIKPLKKSSCVTGFNLVMTASFIDFTTTVSVYTAKGGQKTETKDMYVPWRQFSPTQRYSLKSFEAIPWRFL